jgi:TonB family protein
MTRTLGLVVAFAACGPGVAPESPRAQGMNALVAASGNAGARAVGRAIARDRSSQSDRGSPDLRSNHDLSRCQDEGRYPRSSAQGDGTFRICLDRNGRVEDLEPLRSTGYASYDRRILSTMADWVYSPFVVDGKPMPVCSAVTFVYDQAGFDRRTPGTR